MLLPALVIALSLSSPAAPKKGTWVCLVRTEGDVPNEWRLDLQKAAEDGTKKEWVAPPAVTLEEAQLALGCATWGNECAGQIASMTGASMALLIDVKGGVDGTTLTTQQVKAGGGAVGDADKAELKGTSAQQLAFAKEAVRTALKQDKDKLGFLVVDTDTPGIEVKIDNKNEGKTPFFKSIAPGPHAILLSAEGKAPIQKDVVIKALQTVTVMESLTSAGPAVAITPDIGDDVVKPPPDLPPPTAPADAGPTPAIVGWSLAGVGGLLAIVGGTLTTTLVYDVYWNRDAQGDLPTTIAFGTFFPNYNGSGRGAFLDQASAWMGGSIAAAGVGALLVGTGIVLATSEPAEPAPAPAAPSAR